jgi:predicted amino acid dehydrogenase
MNELEENHEGPAQDRPWTPALTHCLGRFAFLIHPTKEDDLIKSIDPVILQALPPAERQAMKDWILSCCRACGSPGMAHHIPAVPSTKVPGGYAEGWLIAMTQTPEKMMRLGKKARTELIEECVDIAKGLGADVLGLGAFTSIITHNGLSVAGCGLHVTSGNGLTAMSAACSLEAIAAQRGDVKASSRLGIVGAAGSVGRLSSLRLAKTFRQITLFGNPATRDTPKMLALAGEIYQAALRWPAGAPRQGVAATLEPVRPVLVRDFGNLVSQEDPLCRAALAEQVAAEFAVHGLGAAPLQISFDLSDDLHRMHYVLTATSKGKAFVDPGLLSPGTVVCDVARPSDFFESLLQSQEQDDQKVHAYEGGVMNIPGGIRFGVRNVVGCKPGTNLACLSETIVLALSQVKRNYSIGPSTPLDESEEVLDLALAHGFSVHLPPFADQRAGLPM